MDQLSQGAYRRLPYVDKDGLGGSPIEYFLLFYCTEEIDAKVCRKHAPVAHDRGQLSTQHADYRQERKSEVSVHCLWLCPRIDRELCV